MIIRTLRITTIIIATINNNINKNHRTNNSVSLKNYALS